MLRRVTTSVIAAATLIGVAAAPANALIFGTNEGPESERGAVVRVHMLTEGGVAECTGTAVHTNWVLTAQHCIEGLATDDQGRISGTVTTGEGPLGNEDNTFRVNAAVGAPENAQGDVALVHVTEAMNVAPVGINYGGLAAGTTANAYGWSTLGTGATGVLPRTEVTVMGQEQHPLPEYSASQAYVTTSVRPAQLQQGDSGGPIFVGNEVAGVLSVGIGSIFNPVQISGTYMHAKMEGLQGWVNGVLATNPDEDPGAMDPIPGGGIGSLIPQLPVVPGSADIIDIVGIGSL